MSGGNKFDQDKPRTDLLPVNALLMTAEVLTFGANKYASWNWSKGIAYSRLYAAALRHMMAFWYGEDKDPESGLPHLAHALCCIMFLAEFQANPTPPDGLDDRPYIRADDSGLTLR